MNIQQILGRGVQETRFADESLSYTGLRDFEDVKPEVIKQGPKLPNQRPRTKASQNNSYT